MKDESHHIKPGIIKYFLSTIYESRDLKSSYIFLKKSGNRNYISLASLISSLNILIYLIKNNKTKVYDSNIVVFDESIIRLITAGLNLDLDIYDLSLIKESDGLSRIIDNVDS